MSSVTPSRSMVRFIHLPNAVSYASLAGALLAIVAASRGSVHLAAFGLGVCTLCDMFDGRFARLFERESDEAAFGAQLDSLGDAMAFGLAPVAVVYLLAPPGTWATQLLFGGASLFYLVATVTRLAFYNLFSQEADAPLTGMPTTLAGILWVLLLQFPVLPWAPVLLLALGALMVAPLSAKKPTGRVMVSAMAISFFATAVHLLREING